MVGPLYQWVLHPQIQSIVDLQLWMQRANHIFKFWAIIYIIRASLVAQRLRHLPAMWETRLRSLGQEDPLEKEMATHSSIFAWRIPWMEEPGGLQFTGSQRAGHDWTESFITDMNILINISWFMWTHISLGFYLCVKLKKFQIFLFHICSWEVHHQSISHFSFMLSNFFSGFFQKCLLSLFFCNFTTILLWFFFLNYMFEIHQIFGAEKGWKQMC